MRWYYTPYAVPLFITTLIAINLAIFGWRRRATGNQIFAVAMLVIAGWAGGYALELSSVDLATKIFWGKVQYLSITTLPILWFVFALQLTHQDRWLTPLRLCLVSIVPVLTILFSWTNESHGLIWTATTLDTSGPFIALKVSYGAWFWVHWLFSYILLLGGTILLIRMILYSEQLYRWQAISLLLAAVLPWIGNALYVSRLLPVPLLDLTPFAFTLSGVFMLLALYRFRLLDILPVAHKAVIHSINDGIIVLDEKRRIIEINPAAQRLVTNAPSTSLGQSTNQLSSRWANLFEQYQGTKTVTIELALDTPDLQYFEVTFSPLYQQLTQPSGHIVVIRDITAHKQNEEILALSRDEALETSRLKTQLLANVSHDLRTPLNAILGYTEMLQEGIFGSLNDQQFEATTEIIDSTGQMLNFINNLLGQAQIEAGQISFNYVPFTPNQLLDDVHAVLGMLAKIKGINLTYNIAAGTPDRLLGDPYWLRQILINLTSNAIKYTEQGSVSVSIAQLDAYRWEIRVSDTGYGIPPEAQAYIFEPFRQVDSTTLKVRGGSGLGLSIVKQLTTLMGGEIKLESEVGCGSTFIVRLPLNLPVLVTSSEVSTIAQQG